MAEVFFAFLFLDRKLLPAAVSIIFFRQHMLFQNVIALELLITKKQFQIHKEMEAAMVKVKALQGMVQPKFSKSCRVTYVVRGRALL